MIRLLAGDCRAVLATLPAESVQCVVTSPPYYGLRDYGTALWDGGAPDCDHTAKQPKRGNPTYTNGQTNVGYASTLQAWGDRDVSTVYRDTCGKCGAVRVDRQIGLEATPDEYLATMVGVFREVRRVLRRDGTCWVNMGDAYAHGVPTGTAGSVWVTDHGSKRPQGAFSTMGPGLKTKDLLLMPARLALALQADGWWVRSDIIWHKPNPMPESCTDRPTSAHEHVFLLTKSARYFYDADAVREEAEYGRSECVGDTFGGLGGVHTPRRVTPGNGGSRNLRNVWSIATHAYSAAHFATFPPELAERCIKAGTRPGDTVLDPFIGAGTTALVADRLQRDCIGIDLNTQYTRMAMDRCIADAPLLADLGPMPEHPEESAMADLFTDMAAD